MSSMEEKIFWAGFRRALLMMAAAASVNPGWTWQALSQALRVYVSCIDQHFKTRNLILSAMQDEAR